MADQEYMGGNLTYEDDGAPDEGGFDGGAPFDAYAAGMQHGQGVQGMVDQGMAPLLERVTNVEIDRAAEQLLTEFPALDDPQIAEAAVAYARQQAALLGLPPTAVQNPQFMRMVLQSVTAQAQAQPQHQPTIQEQILKAGGVDVNASPEERAARRFWGVGR